jgi:hypothetical protein
VCFKSPKSWSAKSFTLGSGIAPLHCHCQGLPLQCFFDERAFLY